MRYFLSIIFLLAALPLQARKKQSQPVQEKSPRTEMRATWIQTAWQDRYQRMTPQTCQTYLRTLVEKLHATGFNAIIFQVRPEGDAFYHSNIEPWSRFLTGHQGKAPSQDWDPMAYLIEQCHSRGMEFHAWLNPYRMTMSKGMKPASRIYREHPEYFVTFDDKMYLDPGLPESRAYIREVVKDIVTRYDVDAIHMDDYFYPYPVAGKTFDDDWSFRTYAPQMGFDPNDAQSRGNFRRRSVDILIKSLHQDIRALKPWVRFGISPFGIYRNQRSWEGGSQTNGTQCYDDLYADVLLWMQSGWIDYVMPQVYWEIGHSAADYTTLVRWWDSVTPDHCQLYIGQSIERSLDAAAKSNPSLLQQHENFSLKLAQSRNGKHTFGNAFWYAYQIDDNNFHVADFLKESIFAEPALLPAYTAIDDKAPGKVGNVKAELSSGQTGMGLHFSWEADDEKDPMQRPKMYNVYRVTNGKAKTDLQNLYVQTESPEFYDYNIEPGNKYTYLITPVDECNNEGNAVKKSVKVKAAKKKH